MSIYAVLSRIRQEMTSDGVKLSELSARTFLDRMLKSASNFPLDTTTPQENADFVVHEQETARRERIRSVANVLGLAVVTSVNYAQGRILAPQNFSPNYSS